MKYDFITMSDRSFTEQYFVQIFMEECSIYILQCSIVNTDEYSSTACVHMILVCDMISYPLTKQRRKTKSIIQFAYCSFSEDNNQ